jgi:multiple sugar transport system ATP-binding protein
MAGIEFRRVKKVYPDGTRVLEDFGLQIDDGELLVLVGPSGCGKSTVLRILAGLEQITSGEILIEGRVVNERSPEARNVAMVFQNYALYPHMTVRGNLEFPLRMKRVATDEIERRVRTTSEMLGLAEYLDRKPRMLSGGQRQRVAMGRAIIRDAAAFLMDEPLSNLDAALRVQIRSEIAALQRRLGITTIYVTHDQVEAMTLGHRVAVLRDGSLEQVGTPRELYETPATVFVAGFIGSPGMTVFESWIGRKSDGSYTLRFGEQEVEMGDRASRRHAGLHDRVEGSVLAGIRPEAIRLKAHDDEGPSFNATVLNVESLGHETIVYCEAGLDVRSTDPSRTDAGARTLVATLPGHRTIRTGETIELTLDPDHFHVFDLEGRALGIGE